MFINIFIFTLIIIGIDALIEQQRNTHWLFDKTSYPENDNNRISGLFDEEYILGGFVLSLFPSILTIYFFQSSKNKFNLRLITILLILFTYIVIISGERASFIRLLIFIFSIIFVSVLASWFSNGEFLISFPNKKQNGKHNQKNNFILYINLQCPEQQDEVVQADLMAFLF